MTMRLSPKRCRLSLPLQITQFVGHHVWPLAMPRRGHKNRHGNIPLTPAAEARSITERDPQRLADVIPVDKRLLRAA